MLAVAGSGAHAAAVKASRGELTLPTYPWAAVKHPYFRGTDKVNIYPYPMLDFLSRDKTNRTYRTVILENEYLRIVFLPELGGKIHEVIDKTAGRPMFYVNNVIKPGLIGQCGAWTSGGVEWNTGPQGHTVGCMQPVAVEILPAEKDGSRSVAIGETERIYGTKWTVIVTLRPGRSFIEERIRIYNPTETIRPYYFWNCTAMPNTPGFRFIYPMTLGTDHGAEKFFDWPIDHGKDLTRGTNYQDASSIFAWHCDQDFFGSYDDGADRGVVSYANHQQVPGKKAWTWGQGGFGRMHQMDLTDTDGPYNEVQTGPLLTQGEVGRLDPCEAVEWQEWWYPVHGIGGFTFANRDLAANVERAGTNLTVRLSGTSERKSAQVKVWAASNRRFLLDVGRCRLSPAKPVQVRLGIPPAPLISKDLPLWVEICDAEARLAFFAVPLDLPARQPPANPPQSEPTAAELAQAGWQDFLFARFPEAETRFRKSLEKDPHSIPARTGLAFLKLESDPGAAAKEAAAAVAVAPDHGLARFALAVAHERLGQTSAALDEAWQASLDPATAVAGRALAAKLLSRQAKWDEVVAALSEPGPWREDNLCRNRLAYAHLRRSAPKSPDARVAAQLARESLAVDPLDAFARNLLFRTGREGASEQARRVAETAAHRQIVLDLLAEYSELGDAGAALHVFPETRATFWEPPLRSLLESYWLAWLADGMRSPATAGAPSETSGQFLREADRSPTQAVFPHQRELLPALEWALRADPQNGRAALRLGHLLFHLGRHAEGRQMWQKAAELGAEPVIAYRALGMAAKTLEGDLKTAREWLEKANRADPKDSIVARDMARVLLEQSDKAAADADKRALLGRARDILQGAFQEGRGRSDFVALLGRAQNRLGQYAETAAMLDRVRVTVWEGSREVHDLFEDAHVALGEAHLGAGRAAKALAEFNRALEYPENLATGKLENTREAHIHCLRGDALAALNRLTEARAAWKQAAEEPASKDKKKEEARQKARQALEKTAK